MRNLFAVANLLVELSSVNHASQNHQHNTTSIILTAVLGWRSAPDPAGELTTFPRLCIQLGMGTPSPLSTPQHLQCLILEAFPLLLFYKMTTQQAYTCLQVITVLAILKASTSSQFTHNLHVYITTCVH